MDMEEESIVQECPICKGEMADYGGLVRPGNSECELHLFHKSCLLRSAAFTPRAEEQVQPHCPICAFSNIVEIGYIDRVNSDDPPNANAEISQPSDEEPTGTNLSRRYTEQIYALRRIFVPVRGSLWGRNIVFVICNTRTPSGVIRY